MVEGAAGREVELDVLRIAHGGVAVAELEGRVVFVGDTIPGERVLARITDDTHPSWWRAETLRVLDASADRRPHVWAAASIDRAPGERAGGAEFGHIDSARQRALKAEVLVDALTRIGRLNPSAVRDLVSEVAAVPGEQDGTRSRTRLRLHVDRAGRVGPFAARSRRVIAVADLPLAVAELEALLPLRPARGVRQLDLVAADGAVFAATPRDRRPPIRQRAGDRAFALDALGFWQVHPAAAETLTAAVRRAIDPSRFDPAAANLDLYGGVGLLAAALADVGGAATRVTTVEADAGASGHAAENLADLPNTNAASSRVDAFLSAADRLRPGATVVLDPPRSGAGRDVVAAITAAGPEQVVYVACDPVALARDLEIFAEQGYAPVSLEAFDLFPNTHHFEVVAALAR